jgi:1,4-dihydroxy-2-naphthoyl-CoA hydrolase
MSIWTIRPDINEMQKLHLNTVVDRLGIEFVDVGDDWVSARMPVDTRTIQPFGILHGGASVVLAETIGSFAASHCVDMSKLYCVGLDINANHLRAARSGWVLGVARPLHVGKSTQVWEIRITDEAHKLVCIARLTVAVLAK